MKETRKSIIVNEILYWKKSRMLPEQYCDYLLALYTEGNQPKEIRKKDKVNKIGLLNLIFMLLIPISVCLIYFTELSIILQISFSILFVLAGFLLFFYFCRKGILLQVVLIAASLILLLNSVEIISKTFPDKPGILYLNIIINCCLWLAFGLKFRLHYFTISGLLGSLLILISIFV